MISDRCHDDEVWARVGYGIPMVPRPPTSIRPNREKGLEHVRMLGVTWRRTITAEGFGGTSLFDIVKRMNEISKKGTISSHSDQAERTTVRSYICETPAECKARFRS